MSEPVATVKTFMGVFVTLLILTGITVAVSLINLGPFSAVIALTIATIKALLVVLFFMEVRYSPKITMAVIIAGIFWLGILLALSMTDYLSRAWGTYGQ
ncbi:MAG TPA: cytochrome C oxidase subunit IV family protein [Clostridia bacterium]|nr:cytochrome C oxidase subunit IV family protein [Clostridia bacterium]